MSMERFFFFLLVYFVTFEFCKLKLKNKERVEILQHHLLLHTCSANVRCCAVGFACLLSRAEAGGTVLECDEAEEISPDELKVRRALAHLKVRKSNS